MRKNCKHIFLWYCISYSQYNLLTTQKRNLVMRFVEKHTNTIDKLQNRCYYNLKYA